MNEKFSQEAQVIMKERFGKDTLIALATTDGENPSVRSVNSYYENGAFYIITYGLSTKMQEIRKNPRVAICGDWFKAHGVAENLGHILEERNKKLAVKLRQAFSKWYDNGHTNESDPNTCILCIHLTEGVLFSHGVRYEIDFGYKANRCYSYAVGVDDSVYDLREEGFAIREEGDNYAVSFPRKKEKVWEDFISKHLEPGYWNEYLTEDGVVFLFHLWDGIRKYTVHNYENAEVLSICEKLCDRKFGSIRSMLERNAFYKGKLQ